MIMFHSMRTKSIICESASQCACSTCMTSFLAAPLKTRLVAWTPEVAVRLCAQMAAMTDCRMRSSDMADHLAPK